MSSWWSAIHGYRNPILDDAIRTQVATFSHVMFGGLTHEPAVRLAEELIRLAPDPLRHVFFADSGSVSVEVALKLAVQFQNASGRPGRHRFLALRGGYHGDTIAAMSVCDPVDGMHSAFPGADSRAGLPAPPARGHPRRAEHSWPTTPRSMRGRPNWSGRSTSTGDELAAIIVEPVLQGAGGMYVYAPPLPARAAPGRRPGTACC